MAKVRVGSWYAYYPVMYDVLHPPVNYIEEGAIVKVVNKHGCPPANTMGMCYVEDGHGDFLGMVCTNSLKPVKVTRKNGKKVYSLKEG
jgi:hypothetical protein